MGRGVVGVNVVRVFVGTSRFNFLLNFFYLGPSEVLPGSLYVSLSEIVTELHKSARSHPLKNIKN